jgi:hypothetical protein
MATDVHFETFERMPVNPDTEQLLEIQPTSPPTVIETGPSL